MGTDKAEETRYVHDREGYRLIFRKSFRTKDGRVIRRPDGGSFPIWVRIPDEER